MCRVAAARQPQEQAADGKVQRVAVARRDHAFAHGRLKRRRIAEIETRQQRHAIQQERRQRDGRCDGERPQVHRFAAINARRSAIDRVFITWRGSTHPRRAVTMPRYI